MAVAVAEVLVVVVVVVSSPQSLASLQLVVEVAAASVSINTQNTNYKALPHKKRELTGRSRRRSGGDFRRNRRRFRAGSGSGRRGCYRRCGAGFDGVLDAGRGAGRVLTDDGGGHKVLVEQRPVDEEAVVNLGDGVVVAEEHGVLAEAGGDGRDDLGRGVGCCVGGDDACCVESL